MRCYVALSALTGGDELTMLHWVHWFNHQRLLEPIGYIPPTEAKANYWRQLAEKDNLANQTASTKPEAVHDTPPRSV